VYLKEGREKSAIAYHPWVFSGAIGRIDKGIDNGDVVDVYTNGKKFIGRGFYNNVSGIVVRIMAFEQIPIDAEFFEARIRKAKQLRDILGLDTDAARYCNGSGDFLPGLYIDAFDEFLVVQFSSYGLVRMKESIVGAIKNVFFDDDNGEILFKGIYERSDAVIKQEEGMEGAKGVLYGKEPPERLLVNEHGTQYPVFIKEGQKTGFYLDLRTSRDILGSLSSNRSILNLFSYTGSFSIKALTSGAKKVVSVESSKKFCKLSEDEIAGISHLDVSKHTAVCANVFDYLRTVEDNLYDIVVVDPPPLCKNKHDVEKSSRAYKDCNMHAIRVAKDNGFVLTLCCSHHISSDLLQKIVFASAKDAGRMVQIVTQIGHEQDHPVNIYHPETAYFKGFLLRVL
jgi:23S rRNA (cytosine1962-C5)-methyltransferase